MIKDMKFSTEKKELSEKYILPTRIVSSAKVDNAEVLLNDLPQQAIRGGEPERATLYKGGYILFDFGTELSGGIVITVRYLKEDNPDERNSPNPS